MARLDIVDDAINDIKVDVNNRALLTDMYKELQLLAKDDKVKAIEQMVVGLTEEMTMAPEIYASRQDSD